MAEMHEREQDGSVDRDENLLRQRLLRRIGLAGVLIVALVASLAMFDAVFVNTPTHETLGPAAVPVSTTQAPAEEAVKPEEKPAETPVENAPEPAQPTKAEDPPVNEKAEAKPELPQPPAATKGKPETKPITRPASRSEAKQAPVVPEGSAAPTLPPPSQPPVAKPVPARAAPLAAAPGRPLTTGQGYLVQMGVFSNISNAEELKGRLDKAGIPAHIEARVQVGPFKNKTEAEAAQKKLAEMGLSGLLLSPRK